MLFKKKNTTNHILLYTLGYKKIINTNDRHAANVQHTQNFWNDTKERNNITIRYSYKYMNIVDFFELVNSSDYNLILLTYN